METPNAPNNTDDKWSEIQLYVRKLPPSVAKFFLLNQLEKPLQFEALMERLAGLVVDKNQLPHQDMHEMGEMGKIISREVRYDKLLSIFTPQDLELLDKAAAEHEANVKLGTALVSAFDRVTLVPTTPEEEDQGTKHNKVRIYKQSATAIGLMGVGMLGAWGGIESGKNAISHIKQGVSEGDGHHVAKAARDALTALIILPVSLAAGLAGIAGTGILPLKFGFPPVDPKKKWTDAEFHNHMEQFTDGLDSALTQFNAIRSAEITKHVAASRS